MGLQVLNSASKSISFIGGGGDQFVLGTPCLANHYYYDGNLVRYKCIQDTDGTIPLSNEEYFVQRSIDDQMEDIDEYIDFAKKETRRQLATMNVLASGWSSNKTYSFETAYPAASYDIEQIQPIGTLDQVKAWGAAGIVGNPNGNTIICTGEAAPSIDIPIMFYVRKK
jgi:hypothetical protein